MFPSGCLVCAVQIKVVSTCGWRLQAARHRAYAARAGWPWPARAGTGPPTAGDWPSDLAWPARACAIAGDNSALSALSFDVLLRPAANGGANVHCTEKMYQSVQCALEGHGASHGDVTSYLRLNNVQSPARLATAWRSTSFKFVASVTAAPGRARERPSTEP